MLTIEDEQKKKEWRKMVKQVKKDFNIRSYRNAEKGLISIINSMSAFADYIDKQVDNADGI